MQAQYILSTIIILLILVLARVNFIFHQDCKYYKMKYERLANEHEQVYRNLNDLSKLISSLRAENDKMNAELYDYYLLTKKGR
jgi:hypothetical protein